MEFILNTLRNSVFIRCLLLLWIYVRESFLFEIFSKIFKEIKCSYTFKLIRFVVKALKRRAMKFLSVSCNASHSFFALAEQKIGNIAEKVMKPLNAAIEYSKVKSIWMSVCKFLGNSVIFRWLKRDGLHRLSIIVLALYVLIDFVLRDIVGISFLASVWDEALLLLLAVYAFMLRGTEPEIYKNRQSTLGAYILLFMGCTAFLGLVVCRYPAIAFDGYRAVCQYMLWFFVAMRLIRNKSDFMLFSYTLCGLSFLMCLYACYQFVVATPIPASWTTSTEQGVRTRVFSITTSPNIFGCFVVMTAPIVAGLIYYTKNIRRKIILWGVLGVMALACLFTFSRGAWGGAVVAVVVFALLVDKRLFLLMGGAVAAAAVAFPSAVARITYLFTPEYAYASSTGGRALRWQYGLNLLNKNNPWLGFGLGRYGGAVAMQNKVDYTLTYNYMDNYYLKTLVEIGYIGLICFIILLLALCVWSLRATVRMKGESDRPIVCGMFAGLCGVMFHCYFENIFEVPYMNAYFWIIAAFIICRAFIIKKNVYFNFK